MTTRNQTLNKCRSPHMRNKRELQVFEWPVRKHKRAKRGYEYYYRRARRNNAEMRRDGWRTRKEMDK